MQAKLADLYVRTGKREDAKHIFVNAANSLYARGALDAADDVLRKALDLDPSNAGALTMRGQIAVDQGKAADGIALLERVADIDSRPEALHALLGAHLLQKDTASAEPVARKLLNVHNDASGITQFADALMSAGEFQAALRVYNDYADRLFASDASATLERLHGAISKMKDDVGCLDALLHLYRRAGETAHVAEVSELLAHACVQAGELERARDLYKELAAAEPENPIHGQHLRQIQAKLGEDPTARPLTAEEGAQPFVVEEVAFASQVAVEQSYPEDVETAIKAALTDSELFDSYNQPHKAIPVLEQALAKAPRDIRVNQRLASLYVRAERTADAAACCELLATVHAEAGRNEDAKQYQELATKYRVAAAAAPAAQFSMEVAPPVPGATPAAAAAAAEIDLSDEWMSQAEPAAPAAAAAQPAAAALDDVIAEVRFFLQQGMIAEAKGAYAQCLAAAPNSAAVLALGKDLLTAEAPAPAAEFGFTVEASAPSFEVVPPVATSAPEFGIAAPPAQFSVEVPAAPAAAAAAAVPEISIEVAAPAPPPPAAPAATNVLGDFVSGLDEALGDDFGLATPPSKAAPATVAAAAAAAPVGAPSKADVGLGGSGSAAASAPAPVAAPAPAPAASASHKEAESLLSDIFQEFKDDVEQGTPEDDDPETHYNLGVAFKEMGLLDEAIGELQRVCQAVDRGKPFSQPVQAYTWLASCFVEKGVPQAAVKWYERALKMPGVEAESTLAIEYELGAAFEAAGDKKNALQHFMAVYSSNIDYRDVADRIKALKA